jgi:hypothetical protein
MKVRKLAGTKAQVLVAGYQEMVGSEVSSP